MYGDYPQLMFVPTMTPEKEPPYDPRHSLSGGMGDFADCPPGRVGTEWRSDPYDG